MDNKTIEAYNSEAAGFANDWEQQPISDLMHTVLKTYFSSAPTADIGCGSGRDTAWLNENGFPATGFDASRGLLEEAKSLHPGITFQESALPELAGIPDAEYANVLCETVIMHLDQRDISRSVQRLLEILKPGGVLYLSWRVTRGEDVRDGKGRLYAAFDPLQVLDVLATTTILLDEERLSDSSGKLIRRILVRKP